MEASAITIKGLLFRVLRRLLTGGESSQLGFGAYCSIRTWGLQRGLLSCTQLIFPTSSIS